jgi:predicted ATPase
MKTIHRIRLDNFLSFAPGSEAFDLQSLNVLIGPNGSGKSNLIEAFELLRSTPTDLAAAVREGGGAAEWVMEGGPDQQRSDGGSHS